MVNRMFTDAAHIASRCQAMRSAPSAIAPPVFEIETQGGLQ
jgi:hypothetical protein